MLHNQESESLKHVISLVDWSGLGTKPITMATTSDSSFTSLWFYLCLSQHLPHGTMYSNKDFDIWVPLELGTWLKKDNDNKLFSKGSNYIYFTNIL